MKKFLLILSIVLFFGCAHQGPYQLHENALTAQQRAELNLPKEVDLLQLNGEQLKLAYSPDKIRQYHLAPGEQQLVVRYEKVWQDDLGQHEVVSSKLLQFTINAAPGSRFQLSEAMPTTLEDAKRFARNIQLTLQNQNGEQIEGVLVAEAKQLSGTLDVLFNDGGSPYEHLTTWWQEANDSEKTLFRQYIKDNP